MNVKVREDNCFNYISPNSQAQITAGCEGTDISVEAEHQSMLEIVTLSGVSQPRSLNSQGASPTSEQLTQRGSVTSIFLSCFTPYRSMTSSYLTASTDIFPWDRRRKKLPVGFAAGRHIVFLLRGFAVPHMAWIPQIQAANSLSMHRRESQEGPARSFHCFTVVGYLLNLNTFKGSDSYTGNSVFL